MHDRSEVTAMLVDDEAPMRDYLRASLVKVWPELQIIGEAANGIAAAEQAAELSPDIIFLDIRMPGKNGIEAAVELAQRSQVVFVTAYNEYAIQAFERGAVDYLLKPVELERLQQTVDRLQLRIRERRAQVLQSSTAEHQSSQAVVAADQQSQAQESEPAQVSQ